METEKKKTSPAPVSLHLVLTGHWYEQTVHGRKRVEYRTITPHWKKRIWEKRGSIETVTFSKGYTAEKTSYYVEKIDVGPCPLEGWEGDFYRIHFTDSPAKKGKFISLSCKKKKVEMIVLEGELLSDEVYEKLFKLVREDGYQTIKDATDYDLEKSIFYLMKKDDLIPHNV